MDPGLGIDSDPDVSIFKIVKINFNLGPTSLIKDMLNWILRKLPNTKHALIPYTHFPTMSRVLLC